MSPQVPALYPGCKAKDWTMYLRQSWNFFRFLVPPDGQHSRRSWQLVQQGRRDEDAQSSHWSFHESRRSGEFTPCFLKSYSSLSSVTHIRWKWNFREVSQFSNQRSTQIFCLCFRSTRTCWRATRECWATKSTQTRPLCWKTARMLTGQLIRNVWFVDYQSISVSIENDRNLFLVSLCSL